jgi:hypothetical protein
MSSPCMAEPTRHVLGHGGHGLVIEVPLREDVKNHFVMTTVSKITTVFVIYLIINGQIFTLCSTDFCKLSLVKNLICSCLVLGSSEYLLLTQPPQKMKIASKVENMNKNHHALLLKSLTHTVETVIVKKIKKHQGSVAPLLK